jgi:hypothetical protein
MKKTLVKLLEKNIMKKNSCFNCMFFRFDSLYMKHCYKDENASIPYIRLFSNPEFKGICADFEEEREKINEIC